MTIDLNNVQVTHVEIAPNTFQVEAVVTVPSDPIVVQVTQQGPPGRDASSLSQPSNEITDSCQLEINQAYLLTGDSLQLLNLPLTALVDDAIALYGIGTGLFRVTQNEDQTIRFNDALSTMGVTGKLESTNVNAYLELIYVGAHSWLVKAAIGNFEVS